jgi:hypothetical protein
LIYLRKKSKEEASNNHEEINGSIYHLEMQKADSTPLLPGDPLASSFMQ